MASIDKGLSRVLTMREVWRHYITRYNVRIFVETGQAGLGLETLIADLAMRWQDRPPSKVLISELPFRTV